MSRLERFPVGFVATSLGAATFSNVLGLWGFPWLRTLFMLHLGAAAALFIFKVMRFPKKARSEYNNAAVAPFYSIIFMAGMLLSGWLKEFNIPLAKILLLASVGGYLALLALFFFRHVAKGFSWNSFTPAYFVPCLGLLVSTVAAPELLPPPWVSCFIWFGIELYGLMMLLLVYRLARHPYPKALVHAKTIFAAPVSLCIISLLNFPQSGYPVPANLVFILCGLLLLSLAYVLSHGKDFFAQPFNPGYASLTFPMAIASMALLRVSQFLAQESLAPWASALRWLALGQSLVAALWIGAVLLGFYRLWLHSSRRP